mgnify:CR=1 FL=1|tara:strand:- start:439 stop:693 length:255 start_codon:yes stop_codon:yes gene_type:complete
MENFFKEIEEKLKKEINIESIRIIDNSHKHSKHKFFDKNRFHLKLVISSKELLKSQKIKAHRKIMNILKSDMREKIHALEIEIN